MKEKHKQMYVRMANAVMALVFGLEYTVNLKWGE